MNKWISIGLGFIVLAGGFLGYKYLGSLKPEPQKKVENFSRKTVAVTKVENTTIATTLAVQGRLQAFNKIGLFTEVTGTLKSTSRPFKVGTYFPKGAPLLRIDSEEARLGLQAQKASLLNTIATIMPDLKIDYPESFSNWQTYLNNFSVDDPIADLPEPQSQAEKLFIAGRNLHTQFYNIKGQEERLTKYTVYAPFSGVLTQASIDVGAVVRAGQQVGELMATGSYELVATVPLSELNSLRVGNEVTLRSEDISGEWIGKIKRISDQIDAGSQTVEVFIGVSGKQLKEGMYLRGEAQAINIDHAIEIDRDLLIDEKSIFTVEQDSILSLIDVQVLKYNANSVVLGGIPDGIELVTELPAGAFDGQRVDKASVTAEQ